MILETLKALLLAGRDGLQTSCQLAVHSEHISQIHQGSLTFPSLAQLELTGGTLQTVHIGCDALLCGHLAELVHGEGGESGIEVVVRHVLQELLAELPGRNLCGRIERLDVGPRTMHTRGVRSFGLRLSTEMGQLFLMAEVPSRLELEMAKGSGFQVRSLATHFRDDWASRSDLTARSTIENFLIYVRKTETDIQVDIPLGDGTCYVHSGFLVEAVNIDGEPGLKVALDLNGAGVAELKEGTKLHCRVGVNDRSLAFDCTYLDREPHPVVGDVNLSCLLVSVPKKVTISQRRRTFRIQVPSPIPVEIQNVENGGQESRFTGEKSSSVACGRLVDLSFSGARIVGDPDELHGTFPEGVRVRCRVFFPGEAEPMVLLGIIRRSTVILTDEDSWAGDLGVEFLVTPNMDRAALDYLRQYVLAEQRAWLAQRISVSGVGQW